MIDVFVLFVLHSITAHKKTVEKIFCDKVKDGCFSDDLMNSVFDSHPGVSELGSLGCLIFVLFSGTA